MDIRLPKVGDRVNIIEKRNYNNGKLTNGVVRRLLSNPHEVHPRGNKVELEDGTVGRMVSFVDEVGVQTFVDPSRREELTQEIRKNVAPQRDSFRRPRERERATDGHRRAVSDRNETAEPVLSTLDIPGEDDLR